MGPGRLPGHPRRVTQGLFCPGVSPACETKSHWYRSGLFTGRPRRVVLTGVLGFISLGGSGSGVGSVDTTVVSDTAVFVVEVVWSTYGAAGALAGISIVGPVLLVPILMLIFFFVFGSAVLFRCCRFLLKTLDGVSTWYDRSSRRLMKVPFAQVFLQPFILKKCSINIAI